MSGVLSPVMAIAGAGLMQNQGLGVNSTLTSTLAEYNSLTVVSMINSIITTAAGQVSSSTLAALQQLGASKLPVLGNSIPVAYVGALGAVASGGFSGLIASTANNIMGNGDLSQFAQTYTAASGYISQNNMFVNSINNINQIAVTFTPTTGGMDNIQTGGLISITSAFGAFGQDLIDCGELIDLANLRNLGDPSALLRQLILISDGLPAELEAQLRQAGVSNVTLNNIANNIAIEDNINAALYDAMTKVTGTALEQTKALFKCNLPQVLTMADYLDPKKIFARSWSTLTMPTPNGLKGIYDQDGGANTSLIPYLNDSTDYINDFDTTSVAVSGLTS